MTFDPPFDGWVGVFTMSGFILEELPVVGLEKSEVHMDVSEG